MLVLLDGPEKELAEPSARPLEVAGCDLFFELLALGSELIFIDSHPATRERNSAVVQDVVLRGDLAIFDAEDWPEVVVAVREAVGQETAEVEFVSGFNVFRDVKERPEVHTSVGMNVVTVPVEG